MAWIAGVDGCKGGWIAVYEETGSGELECRVEKTFSEVMKRRELAAVAVDMPIGLRGDREGRDCDIEARGILKERRSSIFPAPAEGVAELFRKLGPEKWKEPSAYECAKRMKGLSKQSFYLVPKIVEVARYLEANPKRRSRVHEAHPEVSFAAMNHHEHGVDDPSFSPMQFYKATAGGSIERRALLREVFGDGFERVERQMPELVGKRAGLDDFYDALACLWTARRVHRQGCSTLPENAPCDADALPMRIVY